MSARALRNRRRRRRLLQDRARGVEGLHTAPGQQSQRQNTHPPASSAVSLCGREEKPSKPRLTPHAKIQNFGFGNLSGSLLDHLRRCHIVNRALDLRGIAARFGLCKWSSSYCFLLCVERQSIFQIYYAYYYTILIPPLNC